MQILNRSGGKGAARRGRLEWRYPGPLNDSGTNYPLEKRAYRQEFDQQVHRDQKDRQSRGSCSFCQVEQIVVRVRAFRALSAEVRMDLACPGFQPTRRQAWLRQSCVSSPNDDEHAEGEAPI
jgi:hypothetical protein